tara:strand:- start:48858 stop:49517 length:660 start_codon:yes stop_codon:yes gene_type:complete
MELREAILNRRSYDKYTDKKVDPKLILDILNVAIYAPSSGNMQNWNVVVVDNEDQRKKIAQASFNQLWMFQAPIHIVICDKKPDVERMYGDKSELYSVQNCAALAQNILLLATEKGLSSCWVGSFDKEAISSVVGTRPDETPEIIITLGYSADKPRSTRYKLERVCCFNTCGNKARDVSVFPLEKHVQKIEKESKGFLDKIKGMFKKKDKEENKVEDYY